MEQIKEQIKKDCTTDKKEIFTVNGQGCLDDCPHRHSWTTSTIGCETTYDAFISSKR